MSRAKALPNQRLRQSQENRPFSSGVAGFPQRVSAQKIRLARNGFEPARCGYSGPTSTDDSKDDDDDGDNNDACRTSSTVGKYDR